MNDDKKALEICFKQVLIILWMDQAIKEFNRRWNPYATRDAATEL